ncbi:hypothetical protein EYF80_057301 [Liparis tanakae]|uniref:Uncharacterized protein n=1 Tax=Liparis tanakae TaxID=230148 RepID=A0A4Z2EUP2_9TELE|nr:hypothetical protein EYF80_057301 [Liparis tanakae]
MGTFGRVCGSEWAPLGKAQVVGMEAVPAKAPKALRLSPTASSDCPALERDSCTSKGAVQRERARERESEREVTEMAEKKRDPQKTVAVFRACSAWWD